ncbi:MAG TPA: response regulator [Candidatus Margulisiibacteriota bacterium]|nr:response regulator [Candidatus Margulisiibacteriota bacterium]
MSKTLEAGSAKQRRILVVDDDPDLVRMVRYILRDAGYSVTYAYTGTAGIQKARTEKPDLVLTDLAMPNVSGLDVIETLHGVPETRDIPILAITGHAAESIGQAAQQLGCTDHVLKPFTAEQLLRRIEQCFDLASETAPHTPLDDPQPSELRLRT